MIKVFAKVDYNGGADENMLFACIRHGETGKRYDLRFKFEIQDTKDTFYSPLEPAYEYDGIPCGQTQPLLQAIFDALWASGMRPKEYVTQDQINAVKYHLEDMRQIAFVSLGQTNVTNVFKGDGK